MDIVYTVAHPLITFGLDTEDGWAGLNSRAAEEIEDGRSRENQLRTCGCAQKTWDCAHTRRAKRTALISPRALSNIYTELPYVLLILAGEADRWHRGVELNC